MKGLVNSIKASGHIGFVYALLSVIFMSPIFIIVNIVTREMPTETANLMFFGSGLAVTFMVSTIRRRNMHIIRLAKSHFYPLLLIGGINAVAAMLFFMGIKAIGPSTSAFIARLETVFTVFLGAVILKEKLGKADMVGIAVTVAGALLMTYSDVSLAFGSLFILGSSAVISFQRILLKKYVSRISSFDLNQLRLLFAAAILFVYVISTSKFVVPTPANALLISLGGVTAPVIGFYFMLKSMESMDVSKTMTVKSIEPFIVAVMSMVLFGSAMSSSQITGGAFMAAGIVVLAVAHKKQLADKSRMAVSVD
ncbi:MAG: DMT family transporter [Candidatus Aenigmarchaeota archaeon]|nr:DMT family transporter [Candidatus Aenigmarchaeota archaeon]